jgi:hypothetical protein
VLPVPVDRSTQGHEVVRSRGQTDPDSNTIILTVVCSSLRAQNVSLFWIALYEVILSEWRPNLEGVHRTSGNLVARLAAKRDAGTCEGINVTYAADCAGPALLV